METPCSEAAVGDRDPLRWDPELLVDGEPPKTKGAARRTTPVNEAADDGLVELAGVTSPRARRTTRFATCELNFANLLAARLERVCLEEAARCSESSGSTPRNSPRALDKTPWCQPRGSGSSFSTSSTSCSSRASSATRKTRKAPRSLESLIWGKRGGPGKDGKDGKGRSCRAGDVDYKVDFPKATQGWGLATAKDSLVNDPLAASKSRRHCAVPSVASAASVWRGAKAVAARCNRGRTTSTPVQVMHCGTDVKQAEEQDSAAAQWVDSPSTSVHGSACVATTAPMRTKRPAATLPRSFGSTRFDSHEAATSVTFLPGCLASSDLTFGKTAFHHSVKLVKDAPRYGTQSTFVGGNVTVHPWLAIDEDYLGTSWDRNLVSDLASLRKTFPTSLLDDPLSTPAFLCSDSRFDLL
eukprot:TRINITY_DN64170_c0_g1_i1.p1 TRINITY_DN64170_c0_g1~~TRINITY_DN64170_c0_g1_i1.p1  ORF type:complete len:436 (+),score=51.23 TRINITY_DN64170_c0_g1_i1:74-1309(+)